MIRQKDSPTKTWLFSFAQKHALAKRLSKRFHFLPAFACNVAASRAFIALGDGAKDAVPALVRMYDENITDESRSAIEDALAWIGPASKPAISVLMRGATNTTPRVRADAYWALGDIHAEPALCVPFLIQGLNDSYYWARLSAAHALGMFGTNAQPAIPALKELAKLPSPTQANKSELLQVTLEARKALARIAAPTNAPATEPVPSFGAPTPEWMTPPQ
jgi:HEAT repeat protein